MVKLRAGMTIGKFSPVCVHQSVAAVRHVSSLQTLSTADKRKALETKNLPLDGVALTGEDLHNLIRLLINNTDLFATISRNCQGLTCCYN
jgi:hypothetical protein